MKDNSKKLLLYLFADAQKESLVSGDEVKLVLNNLSPGGLRSLLHVLEQKNYLAKENLESTSYYRVTPYGKSQLKAQFPALFEDYRDWDGSYSQVLFLEYPKTDKNFRYLRQHLIDQRFVSLQRGCYVKPGLIPEETRVMLNKLYSGHVFVFTVGKWQIGDERSFLNDSYLLQDIVNGYSGISSEIDQLLSRKKQSLVANQQLKQRFLSVFDRYYSLVEHDLGLIPYFYPHAKTALELLVEVKPLGEWIART
jgi:DNA-binding transcriptional regulator PaaX